MRWSISELRQALRWHRWYDIKGRLYTFFFWLFKGYTWVSIISLDTFMIDVFVERLKIFKDLKKHGYPPSFNTIEEWQETINEMYELWVKLKDEYYESTTFDEIHQIEENGKVRFNWNKELTEEDKKKIGNAYIRQKENNKRAIELLNEYFFDLWD